MCPYRASCSGIRSDISALPSIGSRSTWITLARPRERREGILRGAAQKKKGQKKGEMLCGIMWFI
jgi:hypothetical protein